MEVSIPTKQELSNKNPFADEAERIAEADTVQKQKNGEGSLVRSRMAGCGSALFFLEKKEKRWRKRKKPLLKQNPVDSSSMPFFSFPKEKTRLPKEKGSTNGRTNLDPCSLIFRVLALLNAKAMTQKHLVNQLAATDRAVRYVLSRLLKEGVILQRASLLDARQSYYEVQQSKALLNPSQSSEVNENDKK